MPKAHGKPFTIILKSGWQVVNIGDIAHTPGMLALIERYLPQAQVIWWPIAINDAVETMIRRRFPKVEILPRNLCTHREVAPEAIRPYFDRADLYLHGSGPNPMAVVQLQQWIDLTGKPYGFGGITVPNLTIAPPEMLSRAAFIFCRDTHSLDFLRTNGIASPVMAFGPDAAFASDVLDEERAGAFMAAHDLKPGGFACFTGRLRMPPFHTMDQWYKLTPEQIERTERINAATAEPDHAKLRHVIIRWVRETGLKTVLCPEMTYQLEDMDELLFDRLPEDVKPLVVRRRNWWITDEASAFYRQARAIVSMKLHSPVLAMAHGTPALHIRQQEDTHKAQMYRDLGLDDWIFEIDGTDGEDVARELLSIHANHAAAVARVTATNGRIAAGHEQMITSAIRKTVRDG